MNNLMHKKVDNDSDITNRILAFFSILRFFHPNKSNVFCNFNDIWKFAFNEDFPTYSTIS